MQSAHSSIGTAQGQQVAIDCDELNIVASIVYTAGSLDTYNQTGQCVLDF